MKISGYITRRRCIGKHLAFVDILVEQDFDSHEECLHPILSDHPNNIGGKRERSINDKATMQAVFHRGGKDSVWNDEQPGDKFPIKCASLPYGALVLLDLCESSVDDKSDRPSYQVKTWKMLLHPKEEAIEGSRLHGKEGICYSLYLKSRGETFSKFNSAPLYYRENINENFVLKNRASSRSLYRRGDESFSMEQSAEFSHGTNRAKALRAKIFATWLIDNYGSETLSRNGGVLDIAGGKGILSIELSLQGKISSTIVDPFIRKNGGNLKPREAKRIRKAQTPHPTILAKEFNKTTFVADCLHDIEKASMFVGLHPDECTEDILDLALTYDKPVAIVPCCVFPSFFPMRELPDGSPVRTFEQFLEYLLGKDQRLCRHDLPFEGRNTVIFIPAIQS